MRGEPLAQADLSFAIDLRAVHAKHVRDAGGQRSRLPMIYGHRTASP